MIPANYVFEPVGTHQHRGVVLAILRRLSQSWAQRGFDNLRAAEIGVYQGDASFFCLERMDNLSMLLVDPYQEIFGSGDSYSDLLGTKPMEDFEILRRRIARHTESGRASILVAPSTVAASWVANRSLAFVFLDGDHEESAVLRDIQAWQPKVAPGGIIAGHDYNPFSEWGAGGTSASQEVSPRLVSPVGGIWRAQGVAAAVHAVLPPGRTLHLGPAGVWWWEVPAEDVEQAP
jgi:hypothetical protein